MALDLNLPSVPLTGKRVRYSMPISTGLSLLSIRATSLDQALQNGAAARLPPAVQTGAITVASQYIATTSANYLTCPTILNPKSYTLISCVWADPSADLSTSAGRFKIGWFDNSDQLTGDGIFPGGDTTMRASLGYPVGVKTLTISGYTTGDLKLPRIFVTRVLDGTRADFRDYTNMALTPASYVGADPRPTSMTTRAYNIGFAPNTPSGAMRTAGEVLLSGTYLNDADTLTEVTAFRALLLGKLGLVV